MAGRRIQKAAVQKELFQIQVYRNEVRGALKGFVDRQGLVEVQDRAIHPSVHVQPGKHVVCVGQFNVRW